MFTCICNLFEHILKTSKIKYRPYSPTDTTSAILKVSESDAPSRTTARLCGLPESSLRHKLSGRVSEEAIRSGPPPLFSMEKETRLSDHLKFTASVGYGHSR